MIKSRLKNAEEKYGLKIPGSFWGYDEPTLALIVNGCGPRGFGGKVVPDKIMFVSVKAACIVHDFMYETGTTEADKMEADDWFLHNMLAIIKKESGFFITKVLRERIAFSYYQVVSEFGGECFREKSLKNRKI